MKNKRYGVNVQETKSQLIHGKVMEQRILSCYSSWSHHKAFFLSLFTQTSSVV